jgi:hypothetical protein
MWYFVGALVTGISCLVAFFLGRARSDKASGDSVPPSPEVIDKIVRLTIEKYELGEKTDSIVDDIDVLLGKRGDGG